MKIEDVLKLVDAGFTADQIREMNAADPAPEPAPSTPDPTPEATPAPESSPAADPQPDPAKQLTEMINQRFAEIISAIKGQLSPSIGDIRPLSIDDIISKFFKED